MIQLQAEMPSGTKSWLIEDAEFTIGRSAECRVQLEHPAVSKIHARISWHSGMYSLHDMGSANGIWVGSDAISLLRFDEVIDIRLGSVACRLQIFDPLFESRGFGRFRVPTALVHVGRSSGNDWVIDHPTVSSEHFIIENQDAVVRLRNVSRQGTRVGGLPVIETTLAQGDEISAGDVKFVYLESPRLGAGAVFSPSEVTGSQPVFRASVTGVLGRDQASALDAYLDAGWSCGAQTIELNLSACSAMHPHALDVLVNAARSRAAFGGRIVLLNPGPAVNRAVALANASQWLSITKGSH